MISAIFIDVGPSSHPSRKMPRSVIRFTRSRIRANTLFFTAGPNQEMDGLFGTLVPIPSELAEVDEP